MFLMTQGRRALEPVWDVTAVLFSVAKNILGGELGSAVSSGGNVAVSSFSGCCWSGLLVRIAVCRAALDGDSSVSDDSPEI